MLGAAAAFAVGEGRERLAQLDARNLDRDGRVNRKIGARASRAVGGVRAIAFSVRRALDLVRTRGERAIARWRVPAHLRIHKPSTAIAEAPMVDGLDQTRHDVASSTGGMESRSASSRVMPKACIWL